MINNTVHLSLITMLRLSFRSILAVCLFSVAIFYIVWQARPLFISPRLIVSNPSKDITIDAVFINLTGETEEGVSLTINGQETYTDENNYFQEEIGLKQGLNIISIKANSRFNKTSEVVRRVIVE